MKLIENAHSGWSGRPAAALAVILLVAGRAAAQDPTGPRRLTLGDAARMAAHHSADAEAARYRAEQARARVTQSRADLLPTLSAYAQQEGRSFNTATLGINLPAPAGQTGLFDPNGQVITGVSTLDVRGRVSQTLIDFGAIGRVRSAGASARASDADAGSAAEQAAETAANAYLRTQSAEAQLSARWADSVLADSLLLIARAQLRAGVGVVLDVTRAESQVASMRAQLIAGRNKRDRARLDLLRALGLPLDSNVQLADSLAALPVWDTLPDEKAAIERALRQRPDLRAADEQLQAARQGLSAIKAERLPTLSLFGDRGLIGKSDHLLGTYTWGLQLNLPILDGFSREGRTEEQRAAARELEVRRHDLEQQAAIDVRAALLDLTSAHEQLDAAREQRRLAQQQLMQAQDRFSAGIAGNADVITASLQLNDSRTRLVDALTAYQSGRVALAGALGSVTTLP